MKWHFCSFTVPKKRIVFLLILVFSSFPVFSDVVCVNVFSYYIEMSETIIHLQVKKD